MSARIVERPGPLSYIINPQANLKEITMSDTAVTKDEVLGALKTVYDPEIPVNVVDLGLVYDVQVSDSDVYVQMTLTFPGCGMGPYIGQQAEWAIQELDGVEEVQIELVFDPPWSPDLISEEARNQLGI
jgi:metal-sulfur cluster biosynthetic enzyme